MLAYVFPGQGSQKKGMGEGLFDEFHELTAKADQILGYSIRELCMEDAQGHLGLTQYTQPALYTVSSFAYLKRIKDLGMKPDYVAGHSLGEYVALFAAGAFDFETGLRLVKKRGELMSRATGGGMAAVIGLSEEKIRGVLEKNNLQSIDIANLNTSAQIVISGHSGDVEKAKPVLEAAGAINYVILNVSGAFHSRYMAEASENFSEYLDKFSFSDLKIPVIANVSARPYKNSEIKKNMIEQIRSSVKWTESIRYLMGKGVINIEQIGPGNVLTGMIKRIFRECTPLTVHDDSDKKITVKGTGGSEEVKAEHTEKAEFTSERLGSQEFREEYGLKYAYISGAMCHAISSKELVVKMGKAGFMGIFGAGGLKPEEIEDAIQYIRSRLSDGQPYCINLLHSIDEPEREELAVDLFLKHNVRNIEASSFMYITPALARLRIKGLTRDDRGAVVSKRRIIGKVSRPEVAGAFLNPVPDHMIEKLLAEKKITKEEAGLAREIPVADDLCVAADSGWQTEQASPYALMPAIGRIRDEKMARYPYRKKVHIGAAGGIGTPEAAAAAFMLGADFIVTGSVNQCTVESGTSESVKDLLQNMDVQDTEYVPDGDLFELGARAQVMKKGVFFPARANKLYDLYRQYDSIEDIDQSTRAFIEKKYFGRSFQQILEEIQSDDHSDENQAGKQNPKHSMALIFKTYFKESMHKALTGKAGDKVDYQIFCGPALGAFNQWVRGTGLENWRNRHVDEIGKKMMDETAKILVYSMNNIFGH